MGFVAPRSKFFCLVLLMAASGCRAPKPLAPVDLAQPGWRLRHGQAVWRPAAQAAEISGELLFATCSDGTRLLEFSKPPFAIVRAQVTTNRWQVQYPHRNRTCQGDHRRSFPALQTPVAIWLHLCDLLTEGVAPPGWVWQTNQTAWRLEELRTGATVEGFLQP
jgi:hypothetical protein